MLTERLLCLLVRAAATLLGVFCGAPAPLINNIAVPSAESGISGAGYLPLIGAGLVLLMLLGVIRF